MTACHEDQRRDEISCPSELKLDLMYHGELTEAEAATVRAQIASCVGCQARWQARYTHEPGFASLDHEAIIDGIARKAGSGRGVGQLKRASIAFAIAATAAVVFVNMPSDVTSIRTKGPEFRVYREREGTVVRMSSGDRFRDGDRIRFAVPTRGLPEVMIVSYETDGKRSMYYPVRGKRSAVAHIELDGALPGAIRLDDYVGEEWLFIVRCPRAFNIDDLQWNRYDALTVPAGCRSTPFLLVKE